MHPTKAKLIELNGMRCMACGRQCTRHELQWHHIVPKYVFRQNHLPIDNSYENGALLCVNCHIKVHEYLFWDDEYQLMMDLVEDHKVRCPP